jgi:ribonuclease HI
MTGAAFGVPEFKVAVTKRATDHLSVYTMELLAILLAAVCVEEVRPDRVVICSDLRAALIHLYSLHSFVSQSRQDLLYEVLQCLYRVKQMGILVMFLWVPAHVGVEGNEKVEIIAKQTLKRPNVEMELSISKTEANELIRTVVKNK